MATSDVIVNGTGKVTAVESPPLIYSSTDVVMSGKASGVVLLVWDGKGMFLSSVITSSVFDPSGVGVVTGTIDNSATPDTLAGGTLELHAKDGSLGIKTMDRNGAEEYWTGQEADGSVKRVPPALGHITVQKA
jgi:hypothetical protein